MKTIFHSGLATALLLGAFSVQAATATTGTAATAKTATTTGAGTSTSTTTGATVLPYAVPPQQEADKPLMTTSGNSCRCAVAENSGGACMILMRTNSGDWIAKNAPQTRMRSSNDGRYYDTPFAVAASACAGHNVNPASVQVHWLDRGSAILEWK